ncbi:MAG TPA: hypothetical protein VFF74_13040 [Methylophilaceae bacterium]|nr:hypothetical protein [Methylophilaceae bacterium]
MNKFIAAILAASLSCISFSGMAGEDMKEKKFNKMDTNKDGMISKDEYMKGKGDKSMWEKFKKNTQGMVDANTMDDQGKQLSMEGDVHKPNQGTAK